MSKSLRLSEKWFNRGLWLVAIVFAFFLTGLGSVIVGDLPKVESRVSIEDHMDPSARDQRQIVNRANEAQRAAQRAFEQASLSLKSAQADTQTARESFNNWLSTRSATQRSEQDPEVIERTRGLDVIQATQRQALAAVQAQQKITLDAQQAAQAAQEELNRLMGSAQIGFNAERKDQELRVFLYRLALTLPLLGLAGWLFATKRKSMYWPFVWGFIIFAGFTFFFELVPYLPSWGGYVRYVVGIIVTVVAGRYAILALNRYLENQKKAELMPDVQRRQELSYDMALARLSKSVCPGCERPVDIKDKSIDFCPHCGIGLYNHCHSCDTRKSTFAKFCHSCGAPPEVAKKAARAQAQPTQATETSQPKTTAVQKPPPINQAGPT